MENKNFGKEKIILDDEIKPEGVNWLIGHFLPGDHPRFSKEIEVALANRTRVRDKETLHYHKKSTEIYLCLAGKITITIENKSFNLNSRELLVVKPFLRHKIKKIEGKSQYLTIKTPSVRSDKF